MCVCVCVNIYKHVCVCVCVCTPPPTPCTSRAYICAVHDVLINVHGIIACNVSHALSGSAWIDICAWPPQSRGNL